MNHNTVNGWFITLRHSVQNENGSFVQSVATAELLFTGNTVGSGKRLL